MVLAGSWLCSPDVDKKAMEKAMALARKENLERSFVGNALEVVEVCI